MRSPFKGLYVSHSVRGRAAPCHTASSRRPSMTGAVAARIGSTRGLSSAAKPGETEMAAARLRMVERSVRRIAHETTVRPEAFCGS
jgi:hypothetical protein